MKMDSIKKRLMDLNDSGDGNTNVMNNSWNEGYLHGLWHANAIIEDQFDVLMNWLKTGE